MLAKRLVSLAVNTEALLQSILDEERQRARHIEGVLLVVADARHPLARDDGHGADEGVDEDHGPVADGGDGLPSGVELLDELDGLGVGGEIPHGPAAARVEDGVEVGGVVQHARQGEGVFPDVLLGVEEVHGYGIVERDLDGLWVDGGETAFG